jgi:hypothetical protein
VLGWDRIVHKNVQSSDGQNSGKIDANSVVIITEGALKEYRILNSQIDGFNDAEVFLKFA